MLVENYFSGGDVEVFVAEDEKSFGDSLDVSEITLIEEGQIIPLFDFIEVRARQLSYTTRLVQGSMSFNPSVDNFVRRPLRGDTVWIRMSSVIYRPETAVVIDLIRLDNVWEHPSTIITDSALQLSVPFTARQMALVRRRRRDVDAEYISQFVDAGLPVPVVGTDRLASATEELYGRVVHVIDADTFEVLLTTGQQITVRLSTVDALEDPWKHLELCPTDYANHGLPLSDKKGGNTSAGSWVWPLHAPEFTPPELGGPGRAPTTDDLDLWGRYASCKMKELLEGKQVRLVREGGANPKDEYDRYLFSVYTIDGLDVEKYLIDEGLAQPLRLTSVDSARYALLQQRLAQARSAAGALGSRGVWHRFSPAYKTY